MKFLKFSERILAPPSGWRPGAVAPPPAPPSLRHWIWGIYLSPGEILGNILQMIRFSVHFERFLHTSRLHFYIEIMIPAVHILWGSGVCSTEKILEKIVP